MNFKPLALALLAAAANNATAQDIPAPRHISKQILATNKVDAKGTVAGWPALAEKDIAWKKRVWAAIDIKDKANDAFNTEAGDEHSFLNTLVAGITSGKIKAYKDTRFREEMSVAEVQLCMKAIAQRPDGSSARFLSKYLIRQDSLGLRTGQIEARIVGIAPWIEGTTANGGNIQQDLFWVYYIDALNYLAESPSTRPGFTWADMLESHSFNSSIPEEFEQVVKGEPRHYSPVPRN